MSTEVLIVDDSDFMRNVLRGAIEGGFDVVGEATDGVEAVDMYEETEPDVVMMDIVMPNSDGIEATEQIKESHPDSKIIMCTSVGQEQKMKQAVDVGADGYITKPFENEKIVQAINEVTQS
ncbi:MAG: response regulator [Halobacteria archaeon]|nr:response regulator [Halobacteria archaeon]